MNKTTFFYLCFSFSAFSQSFAPAPGILGSTAIHKDSSVIAAWAADITVTRGYLNIADQSLGLASYGVDTDGLVAEGDGLAVVSLGDGGSATLTFNSFVYDGPGPDFAIFENGFVDHYMEFAFVEVSSDGLNYVRFNAISETPLIPQMTNFSFGDCRYVNNLAGKYKQGYGTPFDLNELAGTSGLDINQVTHIRLIDVIGSTNPSLGSLDSQNNLINDPYPTAFESGGFDLDGVAVIHAAPLGLSELNSEILIYPNPSKGEIQLSTSNCDKIEIFDGTGKLVFQSMSTTGRKVETGLCDGLYLVKLLIGNQVKTTKLIVRN